MITAGGRGQDAGVADPWLVVGLGNPGPTYAGNRHNVGFRVVDLLSERAGARLRRHKARAYAVESRVAGRRAVLAEPTTYMNDSGSAVAGLRAFYRVPLDRLIVVHDEIDLPYGVLRLKLGGGDNGHNGLRSIRKSLSSGEYLRVRFGVGRPPGRMDIIAYVLRDFSATQRRDLAFLVDRAADAVEALISEGLERAQNVYNTPPTRS